MLGLAAATPEVYHVNRIRQILLTESVDRKSPRRWTPVTQGQDRSNLMNPLAGILPVFQTPFLENESIDAATLEREIGWLFDCGAHGIVMAMVSEVLRLSSDERRDLAALACRLAGNRGPVVISVGAESTRVAEMYARHAQDCGASAVMAIPPIAVSATEQELLRYYERILAAIQIPVIVQDASGYVGRPMPVAMQAALLAEHGPHRVMFKPEAIPIGPKLSELRDATGRQARVFEGTGGLALIDSYRRGIVGTMPGADLIKPIAALWRALVRGDERNAYRLSLPVSSLISMQNSLDAFLAVEKYLLVRQGIFESTRVRGPTGYTLDEETRLEVDRLFDLAMEAINFP
jgi:dihydrodipicolinate synthase/N-acetylneuraminate lyase